MMRKAKIVGVLAAGLMATAVSNPEAVGRVVSSAQSIHRSLREGAGTPTQLSPLERLVFRLVLRSSKASHAANQGAWPEHRS